MTDMTSRAGEGRYEIIFKTDSESAYKKVQEVCREQMRVDEKGVKAWVGVLAADIDELERL